MCYDLLMPGDAQPNSDRTRLRRLPARGRHDREIVAAVLDEAFLCHLGFIVDGDPVVIPTAYGRAGDLIYIHGSAASRAMRAAAGGGLDVCFEVTLTDGLVLARSAFNHSLNYRSVIVYGRATEVADPDEKIAALRILSEHLVQGRWDDIRPPNSRELRATKVLRLPLTESSAKVRSGPPEDEAEDYSLPIWAGVIPLELRSEAAIPDPKLGSAPLPPPGYVASYSRPRPSAQAAPRPDLLTADEQQI